MGARAFAPPPKKKKSAKYFGQYSCKFREWDFSDKYYVKFVHFAGVLNPAVGSRYFLLGPRLPLQPHH